MQIHVEKHQASINLGEFTFEQSAPTTWEAVQFLLLELKSEYGKIKDLPDYDLSENAIKRRNLLKELFV